MATDRVFINFNLRSPKEKTSTIHFIVRWRSIRYVGNTNHSINPSHWNVKSQQAKSNLPSLSEDKKKALRALNKNLNSIRDRIEAIFEIYVQDHGSTPSKEEFIRIYKKGQEKGDTGSMTLLRFIDEVMPFKQFATKDGLQSVRANTVRNYQQAGKKLREFGDHRKQEVNFNSISMEFYQEFITWMQTKEVAFRKDNSITVGIESDRGHSANAIGKIITTLKSIMNYAIEKGYTDNTAHRNKKFIAPEESGLDHIALNVDKLDEMWSLTFHHSEDSKDESHLEIARDLFLVGAWTGLRFSDLERFNEYAEVDLENEQINIMIIQKTQDEVKIPLIDPPVPQILEKYSGKLPHMFNQKANKHIKAVASRLKGFDKQKTITRTEGGRKIPRKYKLCELVTMHTARRSFATNMVKEFGVNPFTVMKITGHKSVTVFENYIKISADDVSDEIRRKVQERRNGHSNMKAI